MPVVYNLSDSEFNQAIVPASLQLLSQQEQCQAIVTDANLRRQIIDFYGSLSAGASFQKAPGKVGCGLWVRWNTGDNQYVIPADRQSSFYSYVICGQGLRSGYGFLLNKALTYNQKVQTNQFVASNGGLTCPLNIC